MTVSVITVGNEKILIIQGAEEIKKIRPKILLTNSIHDLILCVTLRKN